MRNASKILLLGACVLAAECEVGCGADFEPGSRVESPRILALQADKPFAKPGEEVALTLLAANPQDEPLEWAWATCTLPPSSTVDDCVEALDTDLQRFDAETDELRVSIPDDVLDDVPQAARASALIGVVVVACPGELQSGQTLGVPTRCVDEQGNARPIDDLEVGIKRIMLRERDRNDNPVIEAITWDGKRWDEDEVQEAVLCTEDTFLFDDCSESLQHGIGVTTTEREAGRDENGGDFTEQVIVQLYSTHGLFRDQVRISEDANTKWVAQPQPGSDNETATLWFVAPRRPRRRVVDDAHGDAARGRMIGDIDRQSTIVDARKSLANAAGCARRAIGNFLPQPRCSSAGLNLLQCAHGQARSTRGAGNGSG